MSLTICRNSRDRFAQRARLRRFAPLLAAALLLVAGCSAPSRPTPAHRSAMPTPSPTPASVYVGVTLSQVGTVGNANFDRVATVTITNHLPESIAVTSVRPDPPYAPVILHLYVQPDTTRFSFAYPIEIPHEPFQTNSEIATIAPGSSQSWTVPANLVDIPARQFVSGITYRVEAIEFWHTGPLLINGAAIPPLEADGETQITLR